MREAHTAMIMQKKIDIEPRRCTRLRCTKAEEERVEKVILKLLPGEMTSYHAAHEAEGLLLPGPVFNNQSSDELGGAPHRRLQLPSTSQGP